jgi:type I restriction enzyme M protein
MLFIDARALGVMVDRTHRELTDEVISKIASTYRAWRGEPEAGAYEDVPGFCGSATIEQVAENRYVLTPGRYVGTEELEDDGEPIQQKLVRLKAELLIAFDESDGLQESVRAALERIGD